MGREITVIDDSDYVGFAASMVREGEIYVVDVPTMVASVVARFRIYSRVCTPVLICALARIFGATVYAGTGYHNPLYRINFGDYVRAEPGGSFTSGTARP